MRARASSRWSRRGVLGLTRTLDRVLRTGRSMRRTPAPGSSRTASTGWRRCTIASPAWSAPRSTDDRLAVSVIADLVHVHPAALALVFRAKGAGQRRARHRLRWRGSAAPSARPCDIDVRRRRAATGGRHARRFGADHGHRRAQRRSSTAASRCSTPSTPRRRRRRGCSASTTAGEIVPGRARRPRRHRPGPHGRSRHGSGGRAAG